MSGSRWDARRRSLVMQVKDHCGEHMKTLQEAIRIREQGGLVLEGWSVSPQSGGAQWPSEPIPQGLMASRGLL